MRVILPRDIPYLNIKYSTRLRLVTVVLLVCSLNYLPDDLCCNQRQGYWPMPQHQRTCSWESKTGPSYKLLVFMQWRCPLQRAKRY